MLEISNLAELNTVLVNADEENKMVLVDLYATWCGPCKFIAPILHKLNDAYDTKVLFVKVDISKADDIANYYNIQSIPTILFLKGTEILHTDVGAKKEKYYVDKIEELLKNFEVNKMT